MEASLDTAGERVAFTCSIPWVARLIAEGAGGELRPSRARDASLRVAVEATRRPFPTRGWEPLTRGVWRRDDELVVENACTAGFDMHVTCTDDSAGFRFRWRPPARDRVAGWGMRSRFHLLARAVMMQYPVLWWAGTRGRAPLHASACVSGLASPLLVAPGGVGRSTLLVRALADGGRATSDNLAVGDGTTIWGLVEPLRVQGAEGRRMPHGRREAPMRDRAGAVAPDCLIALERGVHDQPALTASDPDDAARALVTATYMAGELRRYWPFAATLAAGTGAGPAQPPVEEVATAFAGALPCLRLALGSAPGASLSELLETVEVSA